MFPFWSTPISMLFHRTRGIQHGLPLACYSKVYYRGPFISCASISRRNLYALCSRGRSKAPSLEHLFVESATGKCVFFYWRSVLMTSFIVNEQPVSGGRYTVNCPAFKDLQFAYLLLRIERFRLYVIVYHQNDFLLQVTYWMSASFHVVVTFFT